MAVKLANNATSRLAASLTASATALTLPLGEGARFPTLGPADWFPLTLVAEDGFEIVRVTARTGDVLTVQRGREDTAARAFEIGARAELRLTALTFTEMIAEKLNLTGGTLTGDLTSSATIAAAVLKVGDHAVWHAGTFNPDAKLGSSGNQVIQGEKLTLQAGAPRAVFQGEAGTVCVGVDSTGKLTIAQGSDLTVPLVTVDAAGKLWTKEKGDLAAHIDTTATAKATAAAAAVKAEVLAAIAAGYVEDVRLGQIVNQIQVGQSPGVGYLMESWGYAIPNYPTGVWRPLQIRKGGQWVTVSGA